MPKKQTAKEQLKSIIATSQKIFGKADTLQMFAIQPSNKVAQKSEALQNAMEIRHSATSIINDCQALLEELTHPLEAA